MPEPLLDVWPQNSSQNNQHADQRHQQINTYPEREKWTTGNLFLCFAVWLRLQVNVPSRQTPKYFSKWKGTNPVSPHRHTQNLKQGCLQGKEWLFGSSDGWLQGQLGSKAIPSLVLSKVIESCSGFSFHNWSPALQAHWGVTLHLPAVRPGSQQLPKIVLHTHETSTHIIAFPTHSLLNLTMTQISIGLPKFVVFSSLSLYLLTIFQHPLSLLKAKLKVKFICFQDTFPSASSGFWQQAAHCLLLLPWQGLLRELLLSKIHSVAWSPRAACCHVCQECIQK